jgi:tRNA(adenine34) deaminase
LRRTRPSHGTPDNAPQTIASLLLHTGSAGGVRERPNRHDWKSCVGKLTVGSNPTSSAAGGRRRGGFPACRLPYRCRMDGDGPDPAKLLDHSDAMRLALVQARYAGARGEVPVGAVALVEGRVVATRHNEREQRLDPTAHAEILALQDAAAVLGTWRLGDVTLVVTLEPCAMCAGALVDARVGRLVFGAPDPKAGACGSLYQLCADPRLNHELPVTGGVLAEECGGLLREFFARRR